MNRFEKWSVWLSTAATALTGVGLIWTKYFVTSEETWAVVNHPWEPWLLKAHILAAPALIFAVGLIASRHIWQHYRAGIRWGRKVGIATVLMAVPMVLTGYLIQVLTDRGWLGAMAIAHIVFSLIFTVTLVLHRVFVYRRPAGRRGGSERNLRSMRAASTTSEARAPEPVGSGSGPE